MIFRILSRLCRFAGLCTLLLTASLLVSSFVRSSAGDESITSGGAVGAPFPMSAVPDDAPRGDVLRLLAERASGTYIGEMLEERDSSLARWPDRTNAPLAVWVQPASDVGGWSPTFVAQVRKAFRQWDALGLPVRFVFTDDSARADVHVTFVDHFEEEISGRTKWMRNDGWWITGADITLAVYHRGGPLLDDEAMHAMTLHEVGHLVGLDHTRDSTSIMAPKVRVRSLSGADRATARLLYSLPAGGVR